MILDKDIPKWEDLCGCRYCDRDVSYEVCKKCREWHTEVEDEPQGVDWIWLTKGEEDEE